MVIWLWLGKTGKNCSRTWMPSHLLLQRRNTPLCLQTLMLRYPLKTLDSLLVAKVMVFLSSGLAFYGCFGDPPATNSGTITDPSTGGQSGTNGQTNNLGGQTDTNGQAGISGKGGEMNGKGGTAGMVSEGGSSGQGSQGQSGMAGIAGMAGMAGMASVAGMAGMAGSVPTTCPTVVVDTGATCEPQYENDGQNCCFQGHVCESGVCKKGICDPIIVADGNVLGGMKVAESEGIVVTDDYLYWGTSHTENIIRISKKAGSNPQIWVTGMPNYHMVSDGQYLYTNDNDSGRIHRSSIANGGVVKIAEIPNVKPAYARIAVKGDWVYAAYFSTEVMLDRGLYRVKTDGSTPVGEVIKKDVSVYSVTADDTHLYWLNMDTGNLERIPFLANDMLGESEIVAQVVQNSRSALANNATHVFVGSEEKIFSVEKKIGGLVTNIGSHGGHTYDMVIDDHFVYWNTFEGLTFRVPKLGGVQQSLTSSAQFDFQFHFLAQDCNNVYMTGKYPGSEPNSIPPIEYLWKLGK
jgi:hypothetical protein